MFVHRVALPALAENKNSLWASGAGRIPTVRGAHHEEKKKNGDTSTAAHLMKEKKTELDTRQSHVDYVMVLRVEDARLVGVGK